MMMIGMVHSATLLIGKDAGKEAKSSPVVVLEISSSAPKKS